MRFSVYCLELNAFKAVSQTACREKCRLLLDGYGVWLGEQWRPYETGNHFQEQNWKYGIHAKILFQKTKEKDIKRRNEMKRNKGIKKRRNENTSFSGQLKLC